MTCWRSASYSCSHCFFRSASLGFGVPFGTGVFFLAAMHFVNSGGSGTDGGAARAGLGCAWPLAAAFSQWLNSFLVIDLVADRGDAVRGHAAAARRRRRWRARAGAAAARGSQARRGT